ncbi:MAG: DUF1003 domain-containing protein [Deltaproteobacteria bacterium]|jgi:uncharacterized membrane protein|nr:DUF1003 domain-containing protein [Deltaproteobacteria bacterium]
MKASQSKNMVCNICGKTKVRSMVMPAALVRSAVAEQIKTSHPDWKPEGYICLSDLNRFRMKYIQNLLESEKGELTSLDHEVLESLQRHETLSSNVDAEFEKDLTLGEKMADWLASFGGSWTFIIIFASILLIWIALNSFLLLKRPFDPYPFILLNLVLSCLAAVQAPVIMMSQNRQEAKDRLRSQHDYRVNLKAELEIRHLHDKIDHLLSHQWERLVEIQQIQIDLISELGQIRAKGKNI